MIIRQMEAEDVAALDVAALGTRSVPWSCLKEGDWIRCLNKEKVYKVRNKYVNTMLLNDLRGKVIKVEVHMVNRPEFQVVEDLPVILENLVFLKSKEIGK